MNVQEITLELSKGTVPGQIVRLGQGDIRGTTIRAVVYDGGAEVDLTGAQASFLIRLPDGRYYVRDANCTVSGNVITYVVDEAHCCLVSGYTDEAYFEFTKDGRTYSTSRFCVKIERAANDGAEIPPGSWDTAVDAAIDAANEAAELANAAATNADATADGVESRVQQMADDAAESAASQVEGRVEAAIDAMGDISELVVPEMSADVRGGAKLEAHGGLALRDGALGIGSLVQESDGYARGGLAEVTAKGHAEQVATTGKNLLSPRPSPETVVNGITYTANSDGSISIRGTATSDADWIISDSNINQIVVSAGSYTFSTDGLASGVKFIVSGVGYNGFPYNELTSASSSSTGTVSDASKPFNYVIFRVLSGTTVNTVVHPQLELGSTATEYEPYTGGAPSPSPDWPQEIQVVMGRNLIDESDVSGTITDDYYATIPTGFELEAGMTYTISADVYSSVTPFNMTVGCGSETVYKTDIKSINTQPNGRRYVTFTPTESNLANGKYLKLRAPRYGSATTFNWSISDLQLELGSTPTPYVPYGHVGMEVRQGSTVLSTTPIPLPQRGWVAGLPDGTADSLRLDGAGHVEWELKDGETDIANVALYGRHGDDSANLFYVDFNNNFYQRTKGYDRLLSNAYSVYGYHADDSSALKMPDKYIRFQYDMNSGRIYIRDDRFTTAGQFNTWLSANSVTILYPLATPVTEDCGYVEDWPTDLPEGATLSIRELDSVGIKYFIDSSVTELARQWYERANSEYADRLTALEQAVAELATS